MNENGYRKKANVGMANGNYFNSERRIRILVKIFIEYNIPKQYYNFGGYKEQSVCFEKEASSWVVYIGERGNKYDVKKYDDLKMACLDMIGRVSDTDEQEEQMKLAFQLKDISSNSSKLVRRNIKYYHNKSNNQYLTSEELEKIIYSNANIKGCGSVRLKKGFILKGLKRIKRRA